MMTKGPLLVLVVSLSLAGLSHADLLPYPGCFFLEMGFKSLGCASGTSDDQMCQYMALALRLELENGKGLCDVFPCIGYDQKGRSCTAMFPRKCSSGDRNEKGLCAIGKECCND